MRINVVQAVNKPLIVLTMSSDEALAILGFVGDTDEVMAKQRVLLESALEEIGQAIEVDQPSRN